MTLGPRKISFLLVGIDVAALILLFNIIGHIRKIIPVEAFIISPLLIPCAVTLFAIYLIDGYRARTDMLSVDYTSQHALAIIAALLAFLLITYVFVNDESLLKSSRGVILLSYALFIPVSLTYRRLIYLKNRAARGETHVVFLGDAASCISFREECVREKASESIIFSVFNDNNPQGITPIHGELRPFTSVLKEIETGSLPVEAVIFHESVSQLQAADTETLMGLHFRGIPTYTLDLFYQTHWHKIPLARLNQAWLFQDGFLITRDRIFARVKRLSDILLAALALLITSPVLMLVALAIKLDDRGAVFFTQNRIGKNRAPFKIYKFRSMRESKGGKSDLYTRHGDARITRIGRFLRTSRLDEFPQLWNVLKGDMSMIGPRAEWDQLVAGYEKEIPCYYFRHLVKPGITGWAQVNYPYGANLEDTLRKLEYDLYYIRHFSFRMDASIVLKTVHIMLFGKGR